MILSVPAESGASLIRIFAIFPRVNRKVCPTLHVHHTPAKYAACVVVCWHVGHWEFLAECSVLSVQMIFFRHRNDHNINFLGEYEQRTTFSRFEKVWTSRCKKYDWNDIIYKILTGPAMLHSFLLSPFFVQFSVKLRTFDWGHKRHTYYFSNVIKLIYRETI